VSLARTFLEEVGAMHEGNRALQPARSLFTSVALVLEKQGARARHEAA
jgi:hypothetical protein